MGAPARSAATCVFIEPNAPGASRSYYALHDRGALQPSETLVVLGASGGVGLAAVQLGKACGARGARRSHRRGLQTVEPRADRGRAHAHGAARAALDRCQVRVVAPRARTVGLVDTCPPPTLAGGGNRSVAANPATDGAVAGGVASSAVPPAAESGRYGTAPRVGAGVVYS